MADSEETERDDDEIDYATPLPLDLPLQAPNEPLPIYDGAATLRKDSTEVAGSAVIGIYWTPIPQLLCRFEASTSDDLGPLSQGDVELDIRGCTGVVRIRAGMPRTFDDHAPWLRGRLYELMTIDHGVRARELRFEIVNLDRYHGAPIKYGAYSWRAGRLNILTDSWLIEVDDREQAVEIEKVLDDVGGYSVTHVARAVRRDQSHITPEDAGGLLTALQMAMSIAAGRWVTPVRPRGFGDDGSVAWELWGLWQTAPWAKPLTWASHASAEDLSTLVREVVNRWTDAYWERLLRSATHYFLEATKGLVNKQLIVGVALLELVGWHLVVEDRRLMSAAGFDRLDTADKIRLLLGLLEADASVPAELKALTAYAQSSHWADGAAAVAEARHIAVHARRRESGWRWDPEVWSDATTLCEAYCDLAMLGLLEYRGAYVDRIRARYAADAAPVPWVR